MNKNIKSKNVYLLAIKKHQENNLNEAKTLYQQILEKNPSHLYALNNLGVIFKDQGENQKAKSCYEKAIEIDPNYADSRNNLGVVFQDLGENQKAKSCYEKVIEINPKYFSAYHNLGIISQKMGEDQKAKECFEKVVEIDPNNIVAFNSLGISLQNLGEYQKAINCYEKIIKIDPNNLDALNNLGVAFQELGEYQKAKKCYDKIIVINSNYEKVYFNYGVVCRELGENQKEKEYYKKAIEINPNYTMAHNNLGIVYQNSGEYQKAINCYERVIEINPNNAETQNNLGVVYQNTGEYQKAKNCYEKAIEIDPNLISALTNLANNEICKLDDLEKSVDLSYKASKLIHKKTKFKNQSISLFRLKHDIQQAKYLSSKDYKINGLDEFQKKGDEILNRKENFEDENNSNKVVLLNEEEINTLLPFYKSDHIYKTKIISGNCINPNKNWQAVEDEYFNSPKQIIYIDDFLSEEALIELREFCLVSKVWNKGYPNKYLGAFSDEGFISPIHLQIAIELKKELPNLFGPHKLGKFWGFKYDTTLGKGINIHADFAVHNLNFWITPDEFNNNKNAGGLKVYDAPAPENWTFKDYNNNSNKIYKYLEDNNANCTKIPYKFNRAVLFNSAYFHETDEIDFKDEYEGRRINMTYLFGTRLVKEI